MDVEQKLKELLHEIDEDIDVESVTRDSELIGDVGMTSVTLLYMALALEDNFGMDFSNTSLNQFVTVGDVIDAIESKLDEEK